VLRPLITCNYKQVILIVTISYKRNDAMHFDCLAVNCGSVDFATNFFEIQINVQQPFSVKCMENVIRD